MLEQKDLFITIKDKKFKLLITLGFWKRCGFTREGANIIEQDNDKYTQALKLAIFYGNKLEYGWSSIEDMSKMITDDDLDCLDENHSDKLSYAMIFYLPVNLRKLIMEKMRHLEENVSEAVDAAMNSIDQDDEEKKN